MSLLRTCLLVVCSMLLLDAAVGQEQARKDAQFVWKQQADLVQAGTGDAPWLTGAHVWGGRADEAYKPFHQWELRLRVGTAAADDWRLRVIPLDSHFQPQKVVKPHWMNVPKTAAGDEVILSYKLNCSAISSYRIEIKASRDLTWAYLAGSLQELPQRELEGKKGSQVLASDVDFEYNKKKRKTLVTFYLANVGDAPAEEVLIRIDFLDENRKTVLSHEYVPGTKKKKGIVEPGYGEIQKVLVAKVPKFYFIALTTSKKEELIFQDIDEAGSANDVAITGLTVKEGVLEATVVNGTDADVNKLALEIDLQDANGATVKTVTLTGETLAAGETSVLTSEVGEISFSGYSMGFAYE